LLQLALLQEDEAQIPVRFVVGGIEPQDGFIFPSHIRKLFLLSEQVTEQKVRFLQIRPQRHGGLEAMDGLCLAAQSQKRLPQTAMSFGVTGFGLDPPLVLTEANED